jgi:excisionase family DNA binding protein
MDLLGKLSKQARTLRARLVVRRGLIDRLSTIQLYISKRELKAHQVGSKVFIKRIDLEEFLEAHPIEALLE